MPEIAIGVTVGRRVNKGKTYDYFEKSVFSTRKAGFDEPIHAFVEPGADQHVPDVDRWNIRVHNNKTKLGCFPNFKHGLTWLLENTDADWVLMVQDDAVWRRDSHNLLVNAAMHPDLQKAGMLSPYTSKAVVPGRFLDPKPDDNRWVECKFHNKAFWGAVAMMFPRASAERLLNESQRFRNHKHHRKLDVIVGNSLRRELQMQIMVHVPSLVDHIGSWSTLGRHRYKGNQWGRRGYLFREK